MFVRETGRGAGALALVFVATTAGLAWAEPAAGVSVSELEARRAAALSRLPGELLVVPARPALAEVNGQGFLQDPNFLYLTGLRRAVGAVLVLDGPARESRLFQPGSLGPFAEHVGLKVDAEVGSSGVSLVSPLDELVPYLRRRVAEAKIARLRLAKAGALEEIAATIVTANGLAPGAGPRAQLRQSLAGALPGTPVEDDVVLSELRLVKSPTEIDRLRRTGAASAAALLAGLRRIAPGLRQRDAEAAIVGACLTEADGTSFWPWAMSGSGGAYPEPWKSLRDPLHLDRRMEPGGLVRVDVGCAYDGYMGDRSEEHTSELQSLRHLVCR